MTALRLRNESAERALLVRTWYATNPFASDGDNRWLDETGVPVPGGSRTESLSPGKSIEFDATRELSLTLCPEGAGGIAPLFESLMRVFGGNAASGRSFQGAVPFTLACVNAQAGVRVRVFAGSAFQFAPLREESIRPGEAVQLSTGAQGVSLRVG